MRFKGSNQGVVAAVPSDCQGTVTQSCVSMTDWRTKLKLL